MSISLFIFISLESTPKMQQDYIKWYGWFQYFWHVVSNYVPQTFSKFIVPIFYLSFHVNRTYYCPQSDTFYFYYWKSHCMLLSLKFLYYKWTTILFFVIIRSGSTLLVFSKGKFLNILIFKRSLKKPLLRLWLITFPSLIFLCIIYF